MHRTRHLIIAIAAFTASACGSSSGDDDAAPGDLQGPIAFPVAWTGELLPHDSGGTVTSTNVILVAADWSATCTDAAATLPAAKFVSVSVLGSPSTGTFAVGNDTGPGFVQVNERMSDGTSQLRAVGTSGTITLTVASTDQAVGQFDVQVTSSADGMTTSLVGTFDAAYCTDHK